MPGLVPGIHVLAALARKTWMAGRSPASTAWNDLRPRQIEDALGDDAEHDLASAAFDRIGLGAQPGARAGAAPGAFAFPFQRIGAAGRHQDFVAALVELGAVIFHRRGERRM